MADNVEAGAGRPTVLALNIKERSTLYAAYISAFKHGGLFVPTTNAFRIGEDVYLLLSLMNDPEKLAIAGKVAWVTPENCQTGKPAGVGVHFNAGEAAEAARKKIHGILGGMVNASRPTHTM